MGLLMVSITVINIDAVIERLKVGAFDVIEKARRGMLRGVELFSTYFIKSYLSLPKPAGYNKMTQQEKSATHPSVGLYVQTGQLRNSWTVSSYGSALLGDTIVRLQSSSSYGIYHDKNDFKDIAPRIPKRIDIQEEFKEKGSELIKDQIIQSVGKLIKRI